MGISADNWNPLTFLRRGGDYAYLTGQISKRGFALLRDGQPTVFKKPDASTLEKQLAALVGAGNGKDPVLPLRAAIVAGSYENKDWFDPKKDRSQIIPTGHCYSIVGYDPVAKIVRLQNPWNDTSINKFGGVFDLTVSDAAEYFGNYAIYTGK